MAYCVQTVTTERVYFNEYGEEVDRTETKETSLVGDAVKTRDKSEDFIEYTKYMESAEWIAKRNLVLKRDGFVCKRCGNAKNLAVHHITYANLGHEDLDDLVTLCKDCHGHLHSLHVSEKMHFDNIEDEEKMIGILLRNNDKVGSFVRIFDYETFSTYKLKTIFEAILSLYMRSKEVNAESVIEELKETSMFDLEAYVRALSEKKFTEEDRKRYWEQAENLK